MDRIRITLEVLINRDECECPKNYPGVKIDPVNLLKDIYANLDGIYDEIHIVANHREIEEDASYDIETMSKIVSMKVEPMHHRICKVCQMPIDTGFIIHGCSDGGKMADIDGGICVGNDICLEEYMDKHYIEYREISGPEADQMLKQMGIAKNKNFQYLEAVKSSAIMSSDSSLICYMQRDNIIIPVEYKNWNNTEVYETVED